MGPRPLGCDLMNTFEPHSQRAKTAEWITPPGIIEALGSFDLDPACSLRMPWQTASRMLTRRDNGLVCRWQGRVWLNPPYNRDIEKWMRRMASHDNGIALTFARVDTDWFHQWVWGRADAIFFFRGRLRFYTPDGMRAPNGAGAPSCLIAYGTENMIRLMHFTRLPGHFLNLALLRTVEDSP